MAALKDSWDGRTLRFAVGFPIVLAAAFSLAALTFRGLVPRGIVLPIGGTAVSFWVFTAISAAAILTVGLPVAIRAARTTVPPLGRRLLLGVAIGCDLLVTALMAASLVAQADTPEAPSARIDPFVFAAGSGAAVALGFVVALAFKPEEQWSRRDQRALALALDPALAADSMTFWIHPRSSVALMILLAGVLPGVLLAVLLPWLGALVVLLALVALAVLSARVDARRDGAEVSVAGLVRTIRIEPAGLLGAAAAVVEARLYGGWGPRRHGTSGSFLAASGPAVVVRMHDGGSYVIGAPDEDAADRLAELLNRRAGEIAAGK
ncbi:MAG TPA: hypothetical protein VIG41_09930 [Micrococcaceae bacterium]